PEVQHAGARLPEQGQDQPVAEIQVEPEQPLQEREVDLAVVRARAGAVARRLPSTSSRSSVRASVEISRANASKSSVGRAAACDATNGSASTAAVAPAILVDERADAARGVPVTQSPTPWKSPRRAALLGGRAEPIQPQHAN